MADYMKLFLDYRLTPSEPHHLEYIKGRLATMKAEDHKAYSEYSAFYGVDMDVKVAKEPEKVEVEPVEATEVPEPEEEVVAPVVKKKRGRPVKS